MDVTDTSSPGPAFDLIEMVTPRNLSAVLVAEIQLPEWAGAPGWREGPLPVLQAGNATTAERGHRSETDASARRTLVALQQGDALYGTNYLRTRYHRMVRSTADDSNPILAMELLYGPTDISEVDLSIGWVCVHVASSYDGLSRRRSVAAHRTLMSGVVRGKRRASAGIWKAAQDLLPPGAEMDSDALVRTVTFQALDVRDDTGADQASLIAAYLLVVNASSDQQVSDFSNRALGHSLTVARPDWSALVLRDGAAFISHQQSEESFADVVRVHTHTIHLDAMLLALLQRKMVDASGSRTVHASLTSPEELVDLERRHFDFKRKYWRTSLTHKRSSPSDDVLRAFQAELLTAQDVAEVQERVKDGAQLARSLNAEGQSRSAQQLAHVVQSATIVIGAFGLAFTAAPVVADPSWRLFGIAGAVGLLAVALALAILHMTGRHARSVTLEKSPRALDPETPASTARRRI